MPIVTTAPETDVIQDLTVGELRDLFVTFLDAAQVPQSDVHRQRIWDAFETSLLTVAKVRPSRPIRGL